MQCDCADLGQHPASWQMSDENTYFSFHTCHRPSWLSAPFCSQGNEAQSSEVTWLWPFCRPVPPGTVPTEASPGSSKPPPRATPHPEHSRWFWEDIHGRGARKPTCRDQQSDSSIIYLRRLPEFQVACAAFPVITDQNLRQHLLTSNKLHILSLLTSQNKHLRFWILFFKPCRTGQESHRTTLHALFHQICWMQAERQTWD